MKHGRLHLFFLAYISMTIFSTVLCMEKPVGSKRNRDNINPIIDTKKRKLYSEYLEDIYDCLVDFEDGVPHVFEAMCKKEGFDNEKIKKYDLLLGFEKYFNTYKADGAGNYKAIKELLDVIINNWSHLVLLCSNEIDTSKDRFASEKDEVVCKFIGKIFYFSVFIMRAYLLYSYDMSDLHNIALICQQHDTLRANYIACILGGADLFSTQLLENEIDFCALIDKVCLVGDPIHWACAFGSVGLISYMHKKLSCNIEKEGMALCFTPFFAACIEGNIEACKYLVSNGVSIMQEDLDGNTGLCFAVINYDDHKNLDIITYLISGENDLYRSYAYLENSVFGYALKNECYDIIDLLVNSDTFDLRKEICRKEFYDRLLGNGSDENNNFKEILGSFCKNFPDLTMSKHKKYFLLYLAVILNNDDLLNYLVSMYKLTGNIKDPNGCTPLHMACLSGNNSMVSHLLMRGANAQEIITGEGRLKGSSPFHFLFLGKADYAAKKNIILRLIFSGGLNPDLKNAEGKSAFDLVEDNKFMVAYSRILFKIRSIYGEISKNKFDWIDKENGNNLIHKLIGAVSEFLRLEVSDILHQCQLSNILPIHPLIFIFDKMIRAITLLLKKTGKKLLVPNKYGQFPIHIISGLFFRLKLLAYIDSIYLKKMIVEFQIKVFDLLVKYGADPCQVIANNDEMDGRMPIHLACCGVDELQKDSVGASCYDCLTKHIIEKHKVDVNTCDRQGKTPLYYAIINGKKSSVYTLIENNADVTNIDGALGGLVAVIDKCPSQEFKRYALRLHDLIKQFNSLEISRPLKLRSDKKYVQDTCIICIEEFTTATKKRAVMKPCNHDMCLDCLRKYFLEKERLVCPMCKAVVNQFILHS